MAATIFGRRTPRGSVQDAVDEEFLLRYNRSLLLPILLVGLAGMFLRLFFHRLGGVWIVLLVLSGIGLLWLGVNEIQWRKARRSLPIRPLDEAEKKG
jgi:succinate dehydrogenase/fumarate reductase cytochrome b subunit